MRRAIFESRTESGGPVIYSDRSRIVADQTCPRLRAYQYEWLGTGANAPRLTFVGRGRAWRVLSGGCQTILRRKRPLTPPPKRCKVTQCSP